jgi:hypothetical protein
MTVLNQTPDLVPADLDLFPRQISTLKGRRFYDATDIITNATEELKWLSGMFPTSLQSLAKVYNCTAGNDCIVLFLRNKAIPGNV